MNSVLVGMFESQSAAASAKARLVAEGFAASAISLIGGDDTTSMSSQPTRNESSQAHQEGGIAHFFRSLFGDDDDESNARYGETYKEAIRRGGYGVTVSADSEDQLERAEQILNDCGAYDIDEKSQAWRQEGWTGGALSSGDVSAPGAVDAGDTRKLQEVEEELKVGKRAVSRGGVRIFTRMTEVPVEESVRLREERAKIERTAVDRPASEADLAAFQEGSIEVREMSEEAVVSKSARVTGEVSVGKEVSEREEVIRDTVRKTKVDVEQIDEGIASGARATSPVSAEGADNAIDRDPRSDGLGEHPVGTAVGATAGGVAAGAAAGSVAGPVGTVVGATVGAVAGGLAGKGAAEAVEPTDRAKQTVKKPI